jgi:hypothetical protein
MEKCFKMFLATILVIVGGVSAQINWRADNITITTEEQLRELAQLVSSGTRNFEGQTITLANNIDLTNEWIPIGDSTNTFWGTLCGNGNTIRGLRINSNRGTQGLFGQIGARGVVKNLRVVDVDIRGKENIGALAGINQGTIANCYVSGKIKGDAHLVGGLVGLNFAVGRIIRSSSSVNVEGNDQVGGLVGVNHEGRITNSSATGNVKGISAGIGGLVGRNVARGSVSSSYATGSVEGNTNNVGGLAGNNEGEITNSFSTGNVKGRAMIGGLVGSNTSRSARIANSYSVGSVIVQGQAGDVGELVGINQGGTITESYAISGNIEALIGVRQGGTISQSSGLRTAEQMKQQSNFNNWQLFNDTWAIQPNVNNGFPHLRNAGVIDGLYTPRDVNTITRPIR